MTKKILIIGASGSIAEVARQSLLNETDAELTLFIRHPRRLNIMDESRETVIKGDVKNQDQLRAAMEGQDIVYANLAGAMDEFADSIVKAMDAVNGPQKLIFITTMGIYQEIPAWLGESPEPYSNSILRPYRKAADIIEASDLNYTIIRPGWLDYSDDTNYELTKKGEKFGGHDVSRKSVADLIIRLVKDTEFGKRESFGINRPEKY